MARNVAFTKSCHFKGTKSKWHMRPWEKNSWHCARGCAYSACQVVARISKRSRHGRALKMQDRKCRTWNCGTNVRGWKWRTWICGTNVRGGKCMTWKCTNTQEYSKQTWNATNVARVTPPSDVWRCTAMLIDTFKVVLDICSQLLTAFVPCGAAGFPVMYTLMTGKTRALYQAVFAAIHDVVPEFVQWRTLGGVLLRCFSRSILRYHSLDWLLVSLLRGCVAGLV